MFEFAYIFLLQRRRLFLTAAAVMCNLILICVLAPFIQTYHDSFVVHAQAAYTNQTPTTDDSPDADAITGVISRMNDSVQHNTTAIGLHIMGAIMSGAVGITHFDHTTVHNTQTAALSTVAFADYSVSSNTHTVISGIMGITHATSSMAHFTGRSITTVLGATTGAIHDVTHFSVGSFIHPQDHTPVPMITQLRATQVALIQSGTQQVAITPQASGTGGACDNGNGNGGYPAQWCNAGMDSIATIAYSNDPINRECTSYAYWYFTTIEGHTNFQAWGNAKYWASTTNYPIKRTPGVGDIAVETAGAYGHVAIVQALPDQIYEGKTVPAGYVLVSEMNYDWNGHFRYSYSPLAKFSAYIY